MIISPTTKQTAVNWLLALLIVAIYAAMQACDGPSDHQALVDQEAAATEAAHTAAAQTRFDRAAAQMCGNAGWAMQPDGAVRCVPRKGSGKPGAVIAVAQVQP